MKKLDIALTVWFISWWVFLGVGVFSPLSPSGKEITYLLLSMIVGALTLTVLFGEGDEDEDEDENAEAVAQAWDRGWYAGIDDYKRWTLDVTDQGECHKYTPTPNPYRGEKDEGGSND